MSASLSGERKEMSAIVSLEMVLQHWVITTLPTSPNKYSSISLKVNTSDTFPEIFHPSTPQCSYVRALPAAHPKNTYDKWGSGEMSGNLYLRDIWKSAWKSRDLKLTNEQMRDRSELLIELLDELLVELLASASMSSSATEELLWSGDGTLWF